MTTVPAPASPRSVLAVTRSRMPHPVLVMALAGTLDAETSSAFADYVDDTLRNRPSTRVLILDLTELALLSHGGLRAVHRASRRIERHGIRVMIAAAPGSLVAKGLESSTGPTFRVFDTRRDAIAATESAALMSA